MAIASFSNLDRFITEHVTFWIWMGVYVMIGLDGRPSAIHITLQSQVIGLALILLATARDWDSFDTSNELSYVFVLGLRGLLAALLALALFMRCTERAAPQRPSLTVQGAPCARTRLCDIRERKLLARTRNARLLADAVAPAIIGR
jgi:hypothetical protein